LIGWVFAEFPVDAGCPGLSGFEGAVEDFEGVGRFLCEGVAWDICNGCGNWCKDFLGLVVEFGEEDFGDCGREGILHDKFGPGSGVFFLGEVGDMDGGFFLLFWGKLGNEGKELRDGLGVGDVFIHQDFGDGIVAIEGLWGGI